ETTQDQIINQDTLNDYDNMVEKKSLESKSDNKPNVRRVMVFIFGLMLIAGVIILIFNFIKGGGSSHKATLFFSDYTYSKLIPVKKEIKNEENREKKLKIIINELVNGPVSNKTLPTIPSNVRVLSTWLSDDVAYINFNRYIYLNLPDNAMSEIMAVYSVVNSVIKNIKGVRRVQILVENVPIKTLKGLTRIITPLLYRSDLVKNYKGD
ncbi:MAG: GerMN domain-containing protein, partial [Spirochaetes bacterium]|nr:GerMN domain-containing protein [Spirochaetota bacterium]